MQLWAFPPGPQPRPWEARIAAALPGAEWVRHPDADHAFSSCRPWLVETVTDWLDARLGC